MGNPAENYMNQQTPQDKLFEDHLGLVKAIAHHVCVKLPPGHSVDDLIQVGMIGLLEASRVYDSSLGASFKSYASIRIRGSIMDELRRQSWVPRSVQKKAREVTQAIQSVERRIGRAASDREIAEELNTTVDEYSSMLESVAGCNIFSLDDENNAFNVESKDHLPSGEFEKEALKNHLAEIISCLPQQEKMVITLYYDNEFNLKEIGEVLGVSESRVCQIHSQAVSRLRARMHEWVEPEFSE